MRRMFCASLLLMTTVSASAFDFAAVQEKAKTVATGVVSACKNDKVKFCDKYKTIEAIKECLKTNQDQLSDGCKKSLKI